MSKLKLIFSLCFVLSFILIGCGDRPSSKPSATSTKSTNTKTINPMNPYSTNPMNPLTNPTNQLIKTVKGLSTPKSSIAYQLTLIKEGDVEKLKACFTERQKKSITADAVTQGKKEVGKMKFEELYNSEKMGEYAGKKTCKIKMKGGRTLTTLVLTDGKWLADTIWFK
ncbi:MAG: hypothetical protein COA79_19980 [Planctomycetota bacterium]|nr:MAG: hypothetical protein COA79_19980 [Planctomycetota bacterium]